MNIFRKFYDTAAETPSIASIMATHGKLNHSETPAPPVVTIPEKKEETPATPAPNAATANGTSNAENPSESPKPSEQPKPAEAKKEEPAPKVPSWQEVLKQQQPDIILKELGFDDDTASFLKGKKGIDKKLLNFYKHWEENDGDISRYVQELSTDYKKMPAEAIMRLQLQREYPKASDKQLDVLYKKEVLEAYKLNPDVYSPEEVEEGRLLLEAKADRYRDDFSKSQEEYLFPKPPQKKDEEAELQTANKQLFDTVQSSIENNSVVKDLLKSNTYTIGEGEEGYNLTLSHTKEAVDNLLNQIASGIVLGTIKKEDLSKITDDYIRQSVLTYEFAKDPAGFLKKMSEHYMTIGGKKVIDPIENAKKPDAGLPGRPEGEPTSIAGQMAKSGRIVSGGL